MRASTSFRIPSPEGLAKLMRLAWPVVLARLGIMTMGLTDAIVVGRHSARELAFHSLGWAPQAVMVTTSVGLLLGVQVMTARMIGAGRGGEVGAVLRRGAVYSLQLGLGATALLVLAGPWVLHRIGLEPGLADGAARALQVFALSLPFYLLSVVGQYFLEALGKPKPGMAAMWVANVVNLGLALWLVPGGSGLPVEGAVAAGWATFFARFSLAAFLVVFILRMREARALGVFVRPAPAASEAAEQRRIGYAAGASYFIEVGAFAGVTLIAGLLGAVGVAAWTIVFNVAGMIFMIPMGLATATAVLVARAYGARDGAGVRRGGALGLAAAAAVLTVICLGVWLGAEPIARAYTHDPAVVAVAAGALVLSCLFFVVDGLQVVAAQALRAAGDVWLPTVLHLISYALIMLPLGWLFALPLGGGVNGIVWSVILASVVSAGLLCARFVRVARRLS